jgi:hypothetical protein
MMVHLKQIKQDTATYLPNFPLGHTDQELMNEFNRVFWGHCYKQYADQFDVLKTFAEHKSYTMKIQKTQPGQGYHIWHQKLQVEKQLTSTINMDCIS